MTVWVTIGLFALIGLLFLLVLIRSVRWWFLLICIVGLPVGALVVLPLVGNVVQDYRGPITASRCRSSKGWSPLEPSLRRSGDHQGRAVGRGDQPSRVALTALEGEATFAFERSRGAIPRRVVFEPSKPVGPPRDELALYAADILRTGEIGRVADRNIMYQVESARGVMAIRLCVSPVNLDPGRYTGLVRVVDRRVEPFQIPIVVTVQYNGWHLILAALWLAFVTAAIFKWVGAERAIDVTITPSSVPRDFLTWASGRLLSLGAAVVAVAALFWSQYWSDPDWGSSPKQLFTLMGAAFAATVTAVSAAEVAKPTAEKGLASRLDPGRQRRRTKNGRGKRANQAASDPDSRTTPS